jgi:glycosyltransferase involved in cell wall biosynthesis
MALRGRLDRYLFSRFWYPRQTSRLAQKYKALFCTNVAQIAHFPGPVITDDDDPVFTAERLALLNRPNVLVVVTTTDQLRDRFIREGLQKPCRVIPSGVYLSSLDQSRVKEVRATLGKRDGDIIIGFSVPYLYTDRDREVRSPEAKLRSISFLAAVMENVWNHNPQIFLWLMGKPSRSVRAYEQEHPQVRLLGYMPHLDVLNYYANFDIAVYPRLVDFSGRHSIKLVEFMAAGVPVVSTAVAESFHITESRGGIIAESMEAFANQILRLAGDTQLRRSLGQAGQHYARQFDWDELAARYEREVIARYV